MKEYPNYLLSSSTISKNDPQLDTNLFSSTENFWVSKSMFKKWNFYRDLQGIQLNIYSNAQVNNFMKEYFQEDLISSESISEMSSLIRVKSILKFLLYGDIVAN